MDFFGIGFLEILAVLLMFAIVFGPHRLPEIAGQFGRAIRELREYARDFRDEYLTDFEEVKEEYLEVRHDLERSDQELREDLQMIEEDVRGAVKEVQDAAGGAAEDAEAVVTEAAGAATGDAAPPAVTPTEAPVAERPRKKRGSSGAAKAARPGNVISINRRRREN